MTFEKILFYCDSPAGMAITGRESYETLRKLLILEDEGKIQIRTKTVEIPAVAMPESCKAVAMFDTWTARTVTLTSAHLISY
jgi:hypothetical protein